MKTKTPKTPKAPALKKDGTPRKARGPMSEVHKAAMQAGRIATKAHKAAALEAVTNPEFQNPKFWAGQPAEVRNGFLAAIQKAQKGERKAEITKLEARLAELTAAEVEG